MNGPLTIRRPLTPAELRDLRAAWSRLFRGAMPRVIYAPGTEPPETLPKRRASDNHQSMECAA